MITAADIISKLPNHLKGFIIDQDYHRYTAKDHAVWRAVMKQNTKYLKQVAHRSYISGLDKTGISTEKIPNLVEMNMALEKIGWAAVTVDGFIPPAAFMEFQKNNVLVIAADIRSCNQIEYTPAPDIIHEAAGHAPIIADPEYAEYLKYFGEIGSKAFSSKSDYRIYESIRHLSILKADPTTTPDQIANAEKLLDKEIANSGVPSEMSQIRNLHWWTVEYGLIGSTENYKIYGAGLLSSIGESKSALNNNVEKIVYSLDAKDYSFDITAPQPQLFVTPDFKHLTTILDEFAGQMSLRNGGIEGIMKAIESAETATIEYSSGIQVSGTFSDLIIQTGQPVYVKTLGPTSLSYNNLILPAQGPEYHKDGFGSPIGKIKGTLTPTRFLTNKQLEKINIKVGKPSEFEFESGLKVKGTLLNITRRDGKILLMTFKDCIVKYEDKILFEPSWGIYDMAVGETITSAFSGPADADGFGLIYDPPAEKTHKIVYSEKEKELHMLYNKTKQMRENRMPHDDLMGIWKLVKSKFSNDWLLATEIYELALQNNLQNKIILEMKDYLKESLKKNPESKLIISSILDDC